MVDTEQDEAPLVAVIRAQRTLEVLQGPVVPPSTPVTPVQAVQTVGACKGQKSANVSENCLAFTLQHVRIIKKAKLQSGAV